MPSGFNTMEHFDQPYGDQRRNHFSEMILQNVQASQVPRAQTSMFMDRRKMRVANGVGSIDLQPMIQNKDNQLTNTIKITDPRVPVKKVSKQAKVFASQQKSAIKEPAKQLMQ